MEAHIKGHANEIPDDEMEGNDAEATSNHAAAAAAATTANKTEFTVRTKTEPELTIVDTPNEPEIASSTITSMLRSTLISTSPHMNSVIPIAPAAIPHTPRESSSSETNSDGDGELNYYNLYSRFEHENGGYNHHHHQSGGVNPALLAAVSIASASATEDLSTNRNTILPHSSVSLQQSSSSLLTPISSSLAPSAAVAQPISNALLAAVNQQDSLMDNSYIYEPLAVMRQQGYFTPAPKVEEFR